MDATGMDRLLSSTRTTLARAWAAAIAQIRAANPVTAVADRLRVTRHPDAIITGLDAAFTAFADAEHAAYNSAANATARSAGIPEPIEKKLLNFDTQDPEVLTWAMRNKLDLVTGLTFEQRSLVRAMLIRIDEESVNPLQAARDIIDSIGLTPAQDAAVASYRARLVAGDYTAALQRALSSGNADRVITAAQAASRQLTAAQISKAVDQYRANFIRLRAETIARTESQRIAHQGSDALYGQAIRRGDIDAEQLECEWVPARSGLSKHERKFHRGIEPVAWGEPFVTGLGNELMFPGDPSAPAVETINCRCARTVRILPAAAMRRAA